MSCVCYIVSNYNPVFFFFFFVFFLLLFLFVVGSLAALVAPASFEFNALADTHTHTVANIRSVPSSKKVNSVSLMMLLLLLMKIKMEMMKK